MTAGVVDLSKFASNNELNKWICQVLGLPDDARKTFDHTELVQILGQELIRTNSLLDALRGMFEQVAHGVIDPGVQTVAAFAAEVVTAIDNADLAPGLEGGEGA